MWCAGAAEAGKPRLRRLISRRRGKSDGMNHDTFGPDWVSTGGGCQRSAFSGQRAECYTRAAAWKAKAIRYISEVCDMPMATINGLEIHYREKGEGFPVVLVHGFTGKSRHWALTVPVLTRTFRTISVDLRGHGHSAKPGGPA